MDKILFIQAGGTIDKDYPVRGRAYAFEIRSPAVKRILESIKPSLGYRIVELLKKDSTDITSSDRNSILKTCREAPEKHIIITHGTDTMVETARALNSLEGKVIVITGSMLPERFTNSDAQFNVGTAMGALRFLKDGVYIAMSGHVLQWNKITKDSTKGQFIIKPRQGGAS